jgi:hypothetical protein
LLLFLITCSSSSLRTDFAIARIRLSQATFDALYKIVQAQSDDDSSSDVAGSLIGLKRAAVEAYMTIGAWGWCVKTADSSK